MTQKRLIGLFALAWILAFVLIARKGKPPMEYKPAQKIPYKHEIHGDVRMDDYFWMRERDAKPVLEFLRQENELTAQTMKPVAELEAKLFTEMKSRMKEDDSSVPQHQPPYYYYSRFAKGQEYRIHCRKKDSLEAAEQVILDENVMAAGHDYFQVSGAELSPNQRYLAFAVDTVGRRIYEIRFKDLETGQVLKDKIETATPSLAWAADNKTLFFVRQDLETLRAYQLWRYEVGSGAQPELVYEEKDTTYNIGVGSSKTNSVVFLAIEKRDSSEWRVLDATKPKGEFVIFHPREMKHEYSVYDAGDRFFVLTNWGSENFRVMEAPRGAKSKREWKEFVPGSKDIYLEGLEVFERHMVISERQNGLSRLRVLARDKSTSRVLSFPDESYEITMDSLPDYKSPVLRFAYESLKQPPTVYDENLVTGERVLKKTKEVPGYNADLYETKRIWASAKDGTRVPISILYKKGLKLDGSNPALMYGYGSYGYSNSVNFWSSMISLVDRGFVFAQAHIRGGSEMGRYWYEQGRLKNKMNTFTDFIASGEKLIADKYTSAAHLHIMGGSAGGLLVGAVMNMRPDLFKSVSAGVPFVDVMTTMLDESIPLTTGEYNEWGDPRKADEYRYMRQYSPYDNVEAKAYPAMLVTTGYHDSQVQYWEPAKWVAKLRDMKTDKNPLLLYTEFEAGHGGASGRYEALKLLAKEMAFILMVEGIKE
jgi:oligopeptidase B